MLPKQYDIRFLGHVGLGHTVCGQLWKVSSCKKVEDDIYDLQLIEWNKVNSSQTTWCTKGNIQTGNIAVAIGNTVENWGDITWYLYFFQQKQRRWWKCGTGYKICNSYEEHKRTERRYHVCIGPVMNPRQIVDCSCSSMNKILEQTE